MVRFENYELVKKIVCLILIMRHLGAFAQQGGSLSAPPIPVNNISTISNSVPTSTNNNQKSDLADIKYSEYQSICRSDLKLIDNVKESYSKVSVAAFLDMYKKEKSANNFEKIFNYYFEHSKIDEMKSLLFAESKNLSPQEIVVYDAKIKFSKKKYNEVVAIINKQLDDTPENEKLLVLLAESYKELNNLFEAKSIYQDLFKKNKKLNEKYLLNLCVLETLDSSHGEAEVVCKQASKSFPQSEIPRIYLGITYREETFLDKAIEQFIMANEIRATEFGTTCLAEAYALKKDYRHSSEWYNKSIALESKSGRAILGLALNDVVLKQYDSALELFKRACDLDKKASLTPLKETYKKVEDLKLKIANQYYAEVQRCSQK